MLDGTPSSARQLDLSGWIASRFSPKPLLPRNEGCVRRWRESCEALSLLRRTFTTRPVPHVARRKMDEHRACRRGTVSRRHLIPQLAETHGPWRERGPAARRRGVWSENDAGFASRRRRWEHRRRVETSELDRQRDPGRWAHGGCLGATCRGRTRPRGETPWGGAGNRRSRGIRMGQPGPQRWGSPHGVEP